MSDPSLRTVLQQPAGCVSFFTNVIYPASTIRLCIIVPVKNEAEHLQHTLDALRLQTDKNGLAISPDLYEVLLLVNNSTDDSYQIAINYTKAYPLFRLYASNIFLSGPYANIGNIRRMLMDEAALRLKLTGNTNTIIASTDGDTFVDSRWVSSIITEIDNGADAVGGRILTKRGDGKARMHHLRDVTYRYLLSWAESLIDPQEHNPWPSHFQYFGANMAVTCEMYELAGRLPKVENLEDMAFHQALLKIDARIRKSTQVIVYTSSRSDGRVAIGFSEQLRKWAAEDTKQLPQMVGSAGPALQSFVNRYQLRKCWTEYNRIRQIDYECLTSVASCIDVPKHWLYEQFINAKYFGAFWNAVEQKIKVYETQLQPIQEAIAHLKSFIYKHPTTAFQISSLAVPHSAGSVNISKGLKAF